MAVLVTLDQAKAQLRIDHTFQDTFLTEKLEEATAIVLNYTNKQPVEGWTAATLPPEVRNVILEATADLYADPGDADRPASRTTSPYDGFLTPAMRGKLIKWHTIPVA